MIEPMYMYALLNALYDKGKDYIDSFCPFIIKGLIENQILDKDGILTFLNKIYNIKMPIHVLDTILDRLNRKKLIKKRKTYFEISRKGIEYSDTFIDEKIIERNINALIDDIYKFCHDKNISLNEEEIKELLIEVINNNLYELIEYVNPSVSIDKSDIKFEDKYKLFEEYIKIANEKKPEYYKILQDMIFGSLISSILYTKSYSDLLSMRKPPVKDLVIYLDTNYFFYLFDMDHEIYTKPALELHALMSLNNIKIKIFSFTIDEICRVVGGYASEYYKYDPSTKVDTIYSSLKSKGWTKLQAREFILNIEKILGSKNIDVEWVPKYEVDNFRPQNISQLTTILKYKPNISENTLIHDLLAIEKISKIRVNPIRMFDRSKVFFLTSDIKLNTFNMVEMGHKNNSTICETMLDRTLTNLLWLRNPESYPSLESIISFHKGEIFIKKSIWDTFYSTLLYLKKEKKVVDEDITMLFYTINIEEVLKQFNDSDVYKINSEFVMEQIKKSRNIEGEIRFEIKEQLKLDYERLFDEKMQEAELKIEREKQKEWNEQIKKIKLNIVESSKNTAKEYSIILSSSLCIIIIMFIYALYNILNKYNVQEFFTFLVPILIGGTGIYGIYSNIKNKIAKYYEKILIESRFSELQIDVSSENI